MSPHTSRFWLGQLNLECFSKHIPSPDLHIYALHTRSQKHLLLVVAPSAQLTFQFIVKDVPSLELHDYKQPNAVPPIFFPPGLKLNFFGEQGKKIASLRTWNFWHIRFFSIILTRALKKRLYQIRVCWYIVLSYISVLVYVCLYVDLNAKFIFVLKTHQSIFWLTSNDCFL